MALPSVSPNYTGIIQTLVALRANLNPGSPELQQLDARISLLQTLNQPTVAPALNQPFGIGLSASTPLQGNPYEGGGYGIPNSRSYVYGDLFSPMLQILRSILERLLNGTSTTPKPEEPPRDQVVQEGEDRNNVSYRPVENGDIIQRGTNNSNDARAIGGNNTVTQDGENNYNRVTIHERQFGGPFGLLYPQPAEKANTVTQKGTGNIHVLNSGHTVENVTIEGRNNHVFNALGGGNDTVKVGGLANHADVDTGWGDDSVVLEGSANNNRIDTGLGNDTVRVQGDATETTISRIDAGWGDDKVYVAGSKQTVTVLGGNGNDSVYLAGKASDWTMVEKDGVKTYTNTGKNLTVNVHADVETVAYATDAGQTGRVWGDPHFVDFDAPANTPASYDVQGEAGKTYNILSDKDIQLNAKFAQYGETAGVNVMSHAGLQLGKDKIAFDPANNVASINGQAMEANKTYTLDKGTAVWDGTQLIVKNQEYEITLHDRGTYLDADIKVTELGTGWDGVNPHGLLGQGSDANNDARTGKTGAGAQGEGAIDGSVTDYVVNDLFDNSFKYNRFIA